MAKALDAPKPPLERLATDAGQFIATQANLLAMHANLLAALQLLGRPSPILDGYAYPSLESVKARARALLLQELSPVQRKQFEAYHAFGAIGSKGGRYIFWLDENDLANVAGRIRKLVLFKDETVFCSRSEVWIPEDDRLLSWKLWIEANEPGFWKIANALPDSRVPSDALGKLTAEVIRSRRPKPA